MKKLVLVLFLALSCILTLSSFASDAPSALCSDREIHCIIPHGFPNTPLGKWLKVVINNTRSTGKIIGCYSGREISWIGSDPTKGSSDLGARHIIFSICTDGTGTNCQQLGQDNHTIIGTDSSPWYTSRPLIYNLNAPDDIMNNKKFPDCSPKY